MNPECSFMPKPKIVLAVLFLFLFAWAPGKAQRIVSLHPYYTEQDAILLPDIEGEWALKSFGMMSLQIEKAGDNFYLLHYGGQADRSLFEAVFIRINQQLYLDLWPLHRDTIGDEDYRNAFLQCHSLFSVRLTANVLSIAPFRYAWLHHYSQQPKASLAFEWTNNGALLTASTQALTAFLAQYGDDPGMFGSYDTLFKVASPALTALEQAQHTATNTRRQTRRQACTPAFPFRNGWLGADADISVPLNDTQSLWFFSDTYVGREGDTRKSPQVSMITNTVGLSTCHRNAPQDMQYFWRDMGSRHPNAIFDSHTTRYDYWMHDATLIGDTLYVLMQKTQRSKASAAPDELFNFTQLGYAMARIAHPGSCTPDRWRIESFPLPFLDFNTFVSHTLVHHGHHVYFWIRNANNETHLIRVADNKLEHADENMEYLSKSGSWNAGLDHSDMAVLFTGEAGNTVRYHSDLKTWVMICGPGFMNRHIRMRTAPALEGPWSEERVIYTCPEQTPGDPLYDKSYFCYLGREHA